VPDACRAQVLAGLVHASLQPLHEVRDTLRVQPWLGLRRDAAERADYIYYRLYARLRLAEALLTTGATDEGTTTLRRTHSDASALGADGLRRQLERLARAAGLDPARQAPAGTRRARPKTPSGS
jgi:hypothetical protein